MFDDGDRGVEALQRDDALQVNAVGCQQMIRPATEIVVGRPYVTDEWGSRHGVARLGPAVVPRVD